MSFKLAATVSRIQVLSYRFNRRAIKASLFTTYKYLFFPLSNPLSTQALILKEVYQKSLQCSL